MTLINLYMNEIKGGIFTCQREISEQMYGDGSAYGGTALNGLKAIMHPSNPYGGRATDAFGYHDWTLALDSPGSPTQSGKPARWAPIYKNLAGQPLSAYGDFQDMLIDLNRGGSQV